MKSSPMRWCVALAASMAVSGCAYMPAAGPTTGQIEQGGVSDPAKPSAYVLVDLNAANASELSDVANIPVQSDVTAGAAVSVLPAGRVFGTLGAGDLLKITFWEPNQSGASLLDKPGLEVTVRVDTDGTIGLPYMGRIRASGRSPMQLEAVVKAAMSGQARDLQVSALVVDDQTNVVVVQGDVARPGKYPVTSGQHGLLDALAVAGGVKGSNHQSLIRVTRGAGVVTRTLSDVAKNRDEDVNLAPGDRVLVTPRDLSFFAFGAVGKPGEQPYDADEINMVRTLARIGGLLDSRANPQGVFVFRRQNADLTRRIAGDLAVAGHDPTQVVYRLDLRNPAGFFVAERLRLLPSDIVYVSDAPVAEVAKVLEILTGLSSIAAVPRSFATPY